MKKYNLNLLLLAQSQLQSKKMKKPILIIFISIIIFSCKEDNTTLAEVKIEKETNLLNSQNYERDCDRIPKMFSSLDEAKNTIESTNWSFKDQVDTKSSSWIRSAHYYSCDEETGYLIICLENKCYVFDYVEKDVWLEFRDTKDHGRYYHKFIKNKYQMYDRIR